MKRNLLTAIFLLSACWTFAANAPAPQSSPITARTSGMQKFPGYFDFYWDPSGGKIWLEISRFDQEFLYLDSLPQGVGSNDIGLDRGQIGDSRVVKFERIGPKVLLVQSNYAFRAEQGDVE